MATNDKIRGGKLQYSMKSETALSSGKIYKHEEVLPSIQSIITKQTNYTYSPLKKLFKNK